MSERVHQKSPKPRLCFVQVQNSKILNLQWDKKHCSHLRRWNQSVCVNFAWKILLKNESIIVVSDDCRLDRPIISAGADSQVRFVVLLLLVYYFGRVLLQLLCDETKLNLFLVRNEVCFVRKKNRLCQKKNTYIPRTKL